MHHARIQRGGGTGGPDAPPPPPEISQKFRGFSNTGPDPLKNHKATKPMLGHLREHSGSVVECLTGDRGADGLSLISVTVLCP